MVCDMLALAQQMPSIPVERAIDLQPLAEARQAILADRPGWPAVLLKAYGRVSTAVPELRRAYVMLPWPRLWESPQTTATIAVERQLDGEAAVLFARISEPGDRPLAELQQRVRRYAETPIDEIRAFRKQLRMLRCPSIVRQRLLWLGLNWPRWRTQSFGTFGLSVYSSLGAESLHPISPLTTTMTYGVIRPGERTPVRIVYDHRVMDGSTVARALSLLEAELHGTVLAELRQMAIEQRGLRLFAA
jgi:hypothetical protein